MKKINIFTIITIIAVAILNSCNMETPSDFAIKTKATYNYTVGNFERKLSQDFTKENLQEKLDENGDGLVIEDYNPGGNALSRQFIIDYPITTIPIDIEEYFKKMDFSDQLEKKNIEEEIEVPTIPDTEEVIESPLPNINDIVKDKSKFGDMELVAPKSGTFGTSDTLPSGIPPIPMHFTDPNFGSLEFYDGAFNITVIPNGTAQTTNIKVILEKNDGTEITSATAINLASGKPIILSLKGKTIYHDMKLKVTGTLGDGTTVATPTTQYTLKPHFSDDIKIKKVTGLTMTHDEMGPDGIQNFTKSYPVTTGGDFVSCVIGDDGANKSTFSIKSNALPSTWSGVTCNMEIALSGALTASNGDFIVGAAETNKSKLLDRTLELNGRTLSAGDITVNGVISVDFNNATITGNLDGTIDPINVTTKAEVKALQSVTVDLSNNGSFDPAGESQTQKFPSDAADYLKEIKMKASGVDITYLNGLPTGNDIKVISNSTFFGVNNVEKTLESKGVTATERDKETLEVRGTDRTLNPAFPDIEFSVKVKLPGATDAHPAIATFKNLVMGVTYKLLIELTPVIDYDYVVIKNDIAQQKSGADAVDTGLNVTEIFNDFLDILGQGDEVTKRLDLQRLPIYLYAIVPDITPSDSTDKTLFERVNFKGKFKARVKNGLISDPVYVLGSDTENGTVETTSSMPTLQKDSDGFITTNVDLSAKGKSDLSEIFNRHEDGSILMDYNITMEDSKVGSNGITIYKTDVDGYKREKNKDDVEVKLEALIVLPLELLITDKNNEGPLTFDLTDLIYSSDDSDLLGRDEGIDTSDFDKYIDTAVDIGGRYALENDYLRYSDSHVITAVMDSSLSTNPISSLGDNGKIEAICSNGGVGVINLTVKAMRDILNCDCFHPTLKALLPAGKCYIPQKAKMNVTFSAFVKTDGVVEL